jgi:uncharacterized protein YecT (DUF1311 family)
MKRIAIFMVAGVLAPVIAAAQPKADRYYSATYKTCLNGAMSTLQMKGCIADEYEAWDKPLNQTYQALMAHRAAADQAKLRDDERAWLKRTKHKCDHAGDDEAGGSLQGVEIDQCNLDETILRTVYLRGLE